MAEHDSDREGREPDEKGVPIDEEAAWAAIVAGYGEEPPDPPGAKPFKSVEDLALLEAATNDDRVDTAGEAAKPAEPDGPEAKEPAEKPAKPLGGSVSFAPGVGPRDYSTPEPTEDDFDEDDEGHFVPPEPPPLPSADPTAKFAWLGVLGGPVLLLLAVVLGWDMTWWLATLAIGGFLGGFATLVMRMRTDEEDDDPGRGAVV
ncbi:membrane protein [Streptomyces olindensis]|nr:membrane protein [Streptomyces olindensis]